jgi:hypothetical protein
MKTLKLGITSSSDKLIRHLAVHHEPTDKPQAREVVR